MMPNHTVISMYCKTLTHLCTAPEALVHVTNVFLAIIACKVMTPSPDKIQEQKRDASTQDKDGWQAYCKSER